MQRGLARDARGGRSRIPASSAGRADEREVDRARLGYPVPASSRIGKPSVPRRGSLEGKAGSRTMSIPTGTGVEDRLQEFDSVVIRFAGDSGDGMQITGNQFTQTSALFGNDLATFPDFPAEIRAPAGTRPG